MRFALRVRRERQFVNLIVNQEDILRLLKADSLFVTIHSLYGPPPNWTRPQGFLSLARIILEQNVSLQSANAHFNKLNNYLKAFVPEEILKLSDEELRLCQISRQKSLYLKELSSAILDKRIDLMGLKDLSLPDVRKQLTSIKGIGDWTADIYLMFCLQSFDIFPIGDVAIVNTVKELTKAANKEEILALAEKWRPLRSLAAYYLWHYYLNKRGKMNYLGGLGGLGGEGS